MKKLFSLIRACMTSDMNIFKIKQKKSGKSSAAFPVLISFLFMFAIWSNANTIFEKMAPLGLQEVVLSLFVFLTTIMVIIEGVYKTGSLIFNCKDDQLLLSLPIKRRTVLFVRVLKFYIFELAFNALFIIPLVFAYMLWKDNIEWTFYLTSAVMILVLPIIPIIISCIIGAITSSVSSRFRFKNLANIVSSMLILIFVLFISLNLERIIGYISRHATSINDLITKIYYPAGLYARLATNFNAVELLIFVLVNIALFAISIYILSLFYFKINSRLKKVTSSSKHININNLKIESKSQKSSLIRKELTTFFKTPVFIVNAGFSLVLFVLATIVISIKFDDVLPALTDPNTLGFNKDFIINNLPVVIFILIAFSSFMTSITNSVISLEGKNINILKSLPAKTKTILMSKIYSSLIITTPLLFIGVIVLLIRFKIGIIESILLLALTIILPLASHFIGILVNLKYPKLDAENSAEVVKQSTSSFVSVMIGMLLAIGSVFIAATLMDTLSSVIILSIFTVVFILIDLLLYLLLVTYGVKKFNKLEA